MTYNGAALRSEPSTLDDNNIILSLHQGDTLWVCEAVTADNREWYRVLYNGKGAYIEQSALSVTDEEQTAAYQASLASPAPTSLPAADADAWICSVCRHENAAMNGVFCAECGSPREKASAGSWTCAHCQTNNDNLSAQFCKACGAKRATPSLLSWTCKDCLHVNDMSARFCANCGKWHCPRCGYSNSPASQFCADCGLKKP